MILTRNDSVPKTANLLACKKWWKVCFPHGDQEKYYRQIYGRAAAQRLASVQKDDEMDKSSSLRVIFPTKRHRPVMIDSEFRDNRIVRAKSIINILKDPFSYEINHVNENGSDSGVDANCTIKNVHKAESNKAEM
jgi:hypothetical protein